jgi:hypothetical protein
MAPKITRIQVKLQPITSFVHFLNAYKINEKIFSYKGFPDIYFFQE